MVHRPNVDPNLAFVLMPFRPPFDSYYDEIIRPAAKSAGLEVQKADEIFGTGPIIHDIWKQIWAATVVIADVTDKNPNVNYELGICHTLNVPTVIITQNIDDVPFDYRHRRCISYDTKGASWQRSLRKSITETLKQVLAGEDVFPELGWPYETSPSRREEGGASLLPATDARDLVIRGSQLVRDAVAFSFGPRGAHVSVNIGGQQAYYKRGTAIARAIRSSQRLEEIGISHAQSLANEMSDRVGDGSKTAILIFQKMLDLGGLALKRNYPRSELLRGMDRAIEAIVASVRAQSKPANKKDSLLQVAKTAAGGNLQLAQIVVDAFAKAGRDGIVVIEHSNTRETYLETQEGMNFDCGYIDDAFLASAETQECVLEDAYVLINESKISSMKDLLPVLEEVAATKKPLLVIAGDVEGEALSTLIVNRKRGTLDCLAVKAPGYADRRKAILQDIAVLTEATAITAASGRMLSSVSLRDLGKAKKIVITKDNTTILGGAGESHVGEHVRAIREQLSRSPNSFDTEKLRERLARLSGAVAAIRIGGMSPQSVVDSTYLAESAMHSVQVAMEEGTVVGGGITLVRAKEALKKISFKKSGEVAGLRVVAEAVEEPLRQLLLNGKMDPVKTLRRIQRARTSETGFNADTGELEDLGVTGIADPVATVTHSVQLAFAHARTLLATAAWDSADPSQKQSTERLIEQDQQVDAPKT